jgi:hypothetical protein
MDKKIEVDNQEKLIHEMDKPKKKTSLRLGSIIVVVAIIAGIGTGYFISSSKKPAGYYEADASKGIKKGEIYGSKDTSTFKDSAEGVLKEGGLDGEGQYHIERPGGDDQTVYVVSSTIDLGEFEGKKIKVWGATYQGQKAGWLMDVGRVEVL